MKSPRQLINTLVVGALIASGMTAVVLVAGPLPSASAAVTTPDKIVTVQRGQQYGAFLTANGDIYTWGNNSNGATGLGLTSGNTDLPTKIADFAPDGEKVVQMSFGGTTSFGSGIALTDAGSVYAWGSDDDGALGNDAALLSKSVPVAVSPTWGSDTPVSITKVAGGGRVVTESGHVYAWGDNENGQIGIDNGAAPVATPVEVPGLYRPTDKVVQISGGIKAMFARTQSSVVLVAGSQANGQRGDGSNTAGTQTYSPAITELSFAGLPSGDSIVSIGSGNYSSFAVSGTGKVWGWGNALAGRFGDGSTVARDEPTPVAITVAMADAGDKVVDVPLGGSAAASMLRTEQGHLYTTGLGTNGQLGDGGTTTKAVFAKITSWPGRGANEPIVSGVMGANSGFAITQKGRLYAWGNSSTANQGGIGLGTQTPNIVSPMLMAGPEVLPDFTDAVDGSITGTVGVGASLTASGGTFAPSDATLTYAWKIGSDTVGTTSSYTPKLADAGKSLTLTVTGKKTGFADSVSTTSEQTVGTVQGFSGTLKAGETLTASDATGTNTWGLSSSSTCSSPTTETGTSFVLPSDSAGTYVQLSQTVDGRTGSGTCVGPIAAATSAATITGAATASGVKGQSFSYTPTVGGAPAPSVTVVGTLPTGVTVSSSSGKLSGTPSVAGSFPVTLKASNGVGTPATLDVTISIDDLVTGLSPTISGAPKVGVEMTASPGGSLAPSASDGATVTYTWQHESSSGTWTDLTGGATYTPGTSEVGRVFRVKVTVSKAGFDSRTENSTATTAAVKGTFSIDAPSITGTAKVGQTLTCAAADGTPGTLSYAWSRGSTPLGSAVAYTLAPTDLGEKVTCTVTAARTGYDDAAGSKDSATIGSGTFNIDAPSITGTAKVGQTLTCVPADGTPGTLSYAWTRGTTPLGSDAAYTLTSADLGEKVTCTVTSARTGYDSATGSKDSAEIGLGSFSIDAPSIIGTAKVGQTLTCVAADGTPGTLSYAWTRGTTPVGLTSTYALAAADRDEKVTCTVTSVRSGYTDATASKDSATVGVGSFSIDAPSITGTAKVGQTLTCVAADGTPGTLSYAWTRGTTPVGSATATYDLEAADLAEKVTCTVTSTRSGYTDATASKDSATIGVGSFTIGAPSITGTAKVGQTLTCAAADGTPGTLSYAWTRGATPVGSVATYALTPADHEEVVSCTVTSARAGYADASNDVDSATVGLGSFSIDAPSITGTAKVGQTLTCVAATGTPGTLSYAWTRGTTPVGSGSTYDLVAADQAGQVTCTVTSARTGYLDATNSQDSATVGIGSFSIGAPTITGTAKVGQALTCAAPVGTLGTVSYDWTRGATSLASGASYVLTPDDQAQVVTCTATSERAGYVAATNDADSEVVGLGSFAIGAPSISGATVVGQPLTCAAAPGTPGSLSYAWARGATALAAGATYVLGVADRGQVVTCTATSVRAGYSSASSQSTSGVVSDGEITGLTARITGTLREGRSVRASTGRITPSSAVRTYQWFADGKPIKHATGRTLLLRKPQAGRKLTVRVTATAGTVSLTTISRARMVHSPRPRLVVLGNPTPGAKVTITATGLKPGRRYTIWLAGENRMTGTVGRTGTVSRLVSFNSQTRPGLRRVRVSTYEKSGTRVTTIHRTVRYR